MNTSVEGHVRTIEPQKPTVQPHNIADAIEHTGERLRSQPGERVLDLAKGTGWGSRGIAQRFPGATVIGADIADKMLEYARGAG
jgi:cyclopropane fatty-acyl-phospholipid synthase-like methyltransferase